MMQHKIFTIARKWAAISALGAAVGAGYAPGALADCSYKINSAWDSGFNASIKITNTTTSVINGWSVQWQYAGNNRATNAWNVNFSGNNPYSASNLSWNAAIQPGQAVEFGVQGTKQPGAAEIPVVSGAACNNDDPATVEKVYLQVDKAEDHVLLFIDGVEKMRWSVPKTAASFDAAAPARLGEKIDITHLLGQGENAIKVVAAADNWEQLFGGYNIKLWADNDLLIDVQEDLFLTGFHPGILYEETVTVDLVDAPSRKILTINSTQGGEAIYLNNTFTGKVAPATFELAPGEYRLGLGSSTIVADAPNNNVHITGQFREQDIAINTQNVTVTANQVPVLDNVNIWRVAAVPYTTVYQGLTRAQADSGLLPPANDIGTLTADDIVVAEKSLNVTSEKWLLPMSYGLMKWDITVLPAVTEPVYHAHDAGIGHEFRWNSAMIDADLSQYDMVVHIIPTRTSAVDANGNRSFVAHPHGGYAGRPHAYIPSDWLDGSGVDLATRLQNVKPSSGMLHESLHTYDGYRLGEYGGVDELHGAEVHGFGVQECGLPNEWVCWYTHYIRSQVGENTSTLYKVHAPAPLAAEDVSTYVGLFNTMRGGRSANQLWSYSKPVSRIRNVGSQSCVDVAWGDTSDNVEIISWNCQSGANQLWSLKHVQNGAYQLVSENSSKCAEFVGGSLLQKTCNVSLAQRYLLEPGASGSFAIKTLAGQCLGFSSSDTFVVEACSANQPRQFWQFN